VFDLLGALIRLRRPVVYTPIEMPGGAVPVLVSVPRLALVFFLILSFPLSGAPRRRAVQPPAPLDRARLLAAAATVADRVTWTYHPRLHWENAVYFDALVLLGEQMNARTPGSGTKYLDRVAAVLLESDDPIETVWWGDGTAFGQATLDLHRVLPPSDPRRAALLTKLEGPMRFAEHAMRATPSSAAARDPWWIEGGYGARFWQDDLYMLVPWLAMYGSSRDGLPANELARNLAYEWLESYVHEHRATELRAVPAARGRGGALLWDSSHALFQHAADMQGADAFWARGNGWALIALARAAEFLDAPYTGGRYDQTLTPAEMREILQSAAASLLARRTADGGWGSSLSEPQQCDGMSETSGTALLTFFLARGVNEGWLDRAAYVPVVMRSIELLLRRVDANGVVHAIQPPDIGPGCAQQSSNHPTINLNYGPGAVLLAIAEASKFSDAEIARRSE
jgi:hypothetical protein